MRPGELEQLLREAGWSKQGNSRPPLGAWTPMFAYRHAKRAWDEARERAPTDWVGLPLPADRYLAFASADLHRAKWAMTLWAQKLRARVDKIVEQDERHEAALTEPAP